MSQVQMNTKQNIMNDVNVSTFESNSLITKRLFKLIMTTRDLGDFARFSCSLKLINILSYVGCIINIIYTF